ncbi:MAG: hypothetical protein R3344_09175, partial [Acidobacteriota bacterium]|nr:hypothetical protein [Acidobacteriota bacterium]
MRRSSRAIAVVLLAHACVVSVAGSEVSRKVGAMIRLDAGEVAVDGPMPDAALKMPADGRLFVAQAVTPWTRQLYKRIETTGCEAIAFIPDNACLLRCESPAAAADAASLTSVVRVERFECSWRIEPGLEAWLSDASTPAGEVRRVRAVAARPRDKRALADAVVAAGGSFGTTNGDGSVIDLWLTREQLRVVACDDHLQYVGAWHPPETYMDVVREDSGADFIAQPGVGPYCGTGVRAEILDSAFDTDHPEFAGRIELH